MPQWLAQHKSQVYSLDAPSTRKEALLTGDVEACVPQWGMGCAKRGGMLKWGRLSRVQREEHGFTTGTGDLQGVACGEWVCTDCINISVERAHMYNKGLRVDPSLKVYIVLIRRGKSWEWFLCPLQRACVRLYRQHCTGSVPASSKSVSGPLGWTVLHIMFVTLMAPENKGQKQ